MYRRHPDSGDPATARGGEGEPAGWCWKGSGGAGAGRTALAHGVERTARCAGAECSGGGSGRGYGIAGARCGEKQRSGEVVCSLLSLIGRGETIAVTAD
ncbi:Os07g0264050 [Oryza sativa Japonica Group]|uniref:Os07g0264050 protein n=1 Tax=Oryza sativa subsp. japonica TaxID=39947 RepID=A0A0N7KN84_ORYSJ|nr:Os07g0264050 [Oryza sativa Japonica Group]